MQFDEANWTGDDLRFIEIIAGTNFNDVITWGQPGLSTSLFGGEGNDTLSGTDAHVVLIGGAGADHLSNAELASYETSATGVYVAFGDAGHWTGDATGDVLVNMFGLRGSDYNDILL